MLEKQKLLWCITCYRASEIMTFPFLPWIPWSLNRDRKANITYNWFKLLYVWNITYKILAVPRYEICCVEYIDSLFNIYVSCISIAVQNFPLWNLQKTFCWGMGLTGLIIGFYFCLLQFLIWAHLLVVTFFCVQTNPRHLDSWWKFSSQELMKAGSRKRKVL